VSLSDTINDNEPMRILPEESHNYLEHRITESANIQDAGTVQRLRSAVRLEGNADQFGTHSHEQITQVQQSLARLKPLDRDTLLAFYYDDQSLGTISQHAEAPVGTIKRRLHVARQRLRQELAWVAGS
jgi:DNA-directed RNA polymerase specialized sigma24 family protein